MFTARRHAKRGSQRATLRVLASLALLAAVLLPALLGGVTYVWCAPLGRVQNTCCCHAAKAALRREAGESHRIVAAIEATCCENHRVDSLPPSLGALERGACVPPCPLVVVPAPELARERMASIEPCAHFLGHPPRAGPTAPLFALHCRYLN